MLFFFSGTELSFPSKPDSPYMVEKVFEAPGMPVCMQSFRQLLPKSEAPFRASFHGFASDVGQLDMTANGQPKRSFVLVDGSGIWFPCVALGQHAENSALKDGMELVLYFCTARGPIGGMRGAINLMRDAMIVAVKQHSVAPQKRTPVDIVERQSIGGADSSGSSCA